MVKGTTRQVVVVKGVDPNLFEQAIFLVRDDVLMKGGITEDTLLEQVQQSCRPPVRKPWVQKLLWALGGAIFTGCLWLVVSLL